ncbi:MAG: Crp/Fnr family transcriptional regulator [Flammeovirgaceae bacterium]|nr:Crp/Fnr family transcriptional regulator [Flammeovirgaceae bacterium]
MNLITELKNRIDQGGLWGKDISLSRNQYLKVKGSVDTNLYYVVNGTLRIFLDNNLEEHTIRFGYQDNFIAALDTFISEKPSDFYIQALKKCELKVVPKKRFVTFMEGDRDNLLLWHKIMEQLIFQQIEREKDILISSPLERYERVLKRSPQLFQEIPSKYIASYLRMSPETLSRLKKP